MKAEADSSKAKSEASDLAKAEAEASHIVLGRLALLSNPGALKAAGTSKASSSSRAAHISKAAASGSAHSSLDRTVSTASHAAAPHSSLHDAQPPDSEHATAPSHAIASAAATHPTAALTYDATLLEGEFISTGSNNGKSVVSSLPSAPAPAMALGQLPTKAPPAKRRKAQTTASVFRGPAHCRRCAQLLETL